MSWFARRSSALVDLRISLHGKNPGAEWDRLHHASTDQRWRAAQHLSKFSLPFLDLSPSLRPPSILPSLLSFNHSIRRMTTDEVLRVIENDKYIELKDKVAKPHS